MFIFCKAEPASPVHVCKLAIYAPNSRNFEKSLKMASKRKINQSVSLTHFGFTSKKLALRDKEAPKDDAGAGPLTTRKEDPLPPCDSSEERVFEAECTEDAANAEVNFAATATSTVGLPSVLH